MFFREYIDREDVGRGKSLTLGCDKCVQLSCRSCHESQYDSR